MRTCLLIVIALLIAQFSAAQRTGQRDFELGGFIGGSYYVGDLNPYKHLHPDLTHFAAGIAIRKNLSKRWALRGGFNYGKVSGVDAIIDSDFHHKRNLQFSSDLYEIYSQIEFNFLPFDAIDKREIFSPYTFIGFSMFQFSPTATLENNSYELIPLKTEGQNYSRIQPAIPFGIGIRLKISDRILTSFEWGIRKTYTDYIDDVSTSYPAFADIDGLAADLSDRSLEQVGADGSNWGTQRGNSKNKDWYTFTGLVLTIRLGDKKDSCKNQYQNN